MNERKDNGWFPSQEEILSVVSETLLAPITYARELKEKFSGSGGLVGHATGILIAALPIVIPLALGIRTGFGNENVASGVLAAIGLWFISGAVVRAVHVEG